MIWSCTNFNIRRWKFSFFAWIIHQCWNFTFVAMMKWIFFLFHYTLFIHIFHFIIKYTNICIFWLSGFGCLWVVIQTLFFGGGANCLKLLNDCVCFKDYHCVTQWWKDSLSAFKKIKMYFVFYLYWKCFVPQISSRSLLFKEH